MTSRRPCIEGRVCDDCGVGIEMDVVLLFEVCSESGDSLRLGMKE